MTDLRRLRVSLTKNGYMKIAELIRRHPRWDVLQHLEGCHRGINLKRSQASNILGADPFTGQLPAYWDEIRQYSEKAIDAFVFVAIVLSHHKLIELFRRGSQGTLCGSLSRANLTDKEYTNLVYAMASLGLCEYKRGSHTTEYDLYSLVFHLQPAHRVVRQLIASKLNRCGWLDPEDSPETGNRGLVDECRALKMNAVFAMTWKDFEAWLNGNFEMEEPDRDFGIRRSWTPRKSK